MGIGVVLDDHGMAECHLCERLAPPDLLADLCKSRDELGCALRHLDLAEDRPMPDDARRPRRRLERRRGRHW